MLGRQSRSRRSAPGATALEWQDTLLRPRSIALVGRNNDRTGRFREDRSRRDPTEWFPEIGARLGRRRCSDLRSAHAQTVPATPVSEGEWLRPRMPFCSLADYIGQLLLHRRCAAGTRHHGAQAASPSIASNAAQQLFKIIPVPAVIGSAVVFHISRALAQA